MDLHILSALSLAALCGGFTQGLTGFGAALVALPLVALVLDLRQAVPVCCLLAMSINLVLISRLHRHIVRQSLVLLLVASLPGMVIGTELLRSVPTGILKGVLGLTALAFVAGSLRRRKSPPARAGKCFTLAAGFVAGCMGATIGVNGPPIAAWASRQDFDRNAARATMTAYFLLAGIGVVSAQYLAGLITRGVLAKSAVAIPALLAGLAAGTACCGRIGERTFSQLILVVLALSGTSLLVQALWGMPGR